MIYRVDDIIRDVRIAIDQNSGDEFLTAVGDMDTLFLNEMIRSKIVDAVRSVEIEAPLYMIDIGSNFGDNIHWKEYEGVGSGYILLPDDFMRLIVFQMSDWITSVSEVITPSMALYKLQSSRFPGIRGNIQNPVCAIVVYPIGRVLEFYSCSGGSDVKIQKAVYLKEPEIDEDDLIYICERCYRPAVYYCAALVSTVCELGKQSELLFKISKDLLV